MYNSIFIKSKNFRVGPWYLQCENMSLSSAKTAKAAEKITDVASWDGGIGWFVCIPGQYIWHSQQSDLTGLCLQLYNTTAPLPTDT